MTAGLGRLTASLRELRTRTGLSLAALAQRTTYSKSSWERYLNGKALPPRQAVRDLCRITGEPEGRLLALWEIAESEWSGRAAPAPPPPVSPQTPPPSPGTHDGGGPVPARERGRGGVGLLVALTAACVVIVGGVAVSVLPLMDGEGAQGSEPLPSAPQSGYVLTSRCHGASCEGKDPISMVCGIAPVSIDTHHTATGADVEVRYSERCGTAWARMWGARIGDRVDITGAGPTHEVRTADQVDAETYVFTEMTAARPGQPLRYCFRPAAAKAKRQCFGARVKTPGQSPR